MEIQFVLIKSNSSGLRSAGVGMLVVADCWQGVRAERLTREEWSLCWTERKMIQGSHEEYHLEENQVNKLNM